MNMISSIFWLLKSHGL